MGAEQSQGYSVEYNADGVTWSEAESFCISTYGTRLGSIHSDEDNAYVLSLLPTTNTLAWIGLNDELNENTFVWSDGSLFDYESFYDATSEPNGGTNENCFCYYNSGDWIDISCSTSVINYFICNKPSNITTTTEGPTTTTPATWYTNSSQQYAIIYDKNGMTWFEAESHCQNNFATNLASFHEEEDVINLIHGFLDLGNIDGLLDGFWVGANDINNEDTWVWSDGSPFNDTWVWDSNYNNSNNGYPNGGSGDNCGEIRLESVRNNLYLFPDDMYCSLKRKYFVCNNNNNPKHLYSSNSNYYGIESTYVLSWYDAHLYCVSEYGSDLATIEDASENMLAWEVTGNEHAWIGLNDILEEETWSWIEDGLTSDYFNWNQDTNEPQGGTNENCVSFYGGNNGVWIDAPCEDNLFVKHFVCNV